MTIAIAKIPAFQCKVQDSFNPEWRLESWNFLRQARIELTEAIDHVGTTQTTNWWKKMPKNIPQVAFEIVDALVFTSLHMVRELECTDLAGVTLASKLIEGYNTADIDRQDEDFVLDDDFILDKLDAAIDCLDECHYEVGLVLVGEIINYIGLTLSDILRLYIGKGALNEFRQENGYKQGTYVKIWDGKEDNVWLYEACTASFDNVNPIGQTIDGDTDISVIKQDIKTVLGIHYERLGYEGNTEIQSYT